jgi:D-alanyl-D-alanine carboxypeptidase (penicillin-binding protein 5/6)
VTAADVADTARRQARGESVVAVRPGEVLTRAEALQAVLVPSANNVAILLARTVSGSRDAFVRDMNAKAQRLGMRHTRYTDPSGFDPATVSTAFDQLLLVRAAMAVPELARIVALPTVEDPVAGTLVNTNALLGHGGFVGVKTGSTQAAGGCFAFRVVRDGEVLSGVVLGQRGGPLIAAGLDAAEALADRALSSRPP